MKSFKTAAAATALCAVLTACVLQSAAAEPVAAAPAERSITLKKGDSLQSLAKAQGVSVEDLAKANDLKPPYRLTAGDQLKLPAKAEGKTARAPAEKASSEKTPAAKASGDTVKVAKGDTLASISRKTGVPIESLAGVNGLEKPYKLKLGQTLKLGGAAAPPAKAEGGPAESAKAESAKASKSQPSSSEADSEPTTSITVGRRDTLQSLAKRAKVSVEALIRLNHLKKPYRLRRGETIKLPEGPLPTAGGDSRSDAGSQDAGATVKAGRHDTLKSIAAKAGVSVETLAKLNGIKRPYRIYWGQPIRLPGGTPAAYRVETGDSLYSIARRFGTDPKTLADLNKLDLNEALKVGRRIALPHGVEDRIAPTGRRAPAPVEMIAAPPPSAPTPSAPTPAPAEAPVASAGGAAPADTPADAAVDPALAGKGLFAWPVRGEILSAFGPKPGAQTNDGLDIASNPGDPVRASAGGEVAYSGNSVPGFGNLVLIRHPGGWVTAYAHLGAISVKMRQMVVQGQEIGSIGKGGDAGAPALHFEMRYAPSVNERARPIDPMTVLPK